MSAGTPTLPWPPSGRRRHGDVRVWRSRGRAAIATCRCRNVHGLGPQLVGRTSPARGRRQATHTVPSPRRDHARRLRGREQMRAHRQTWLPHHACRRRCRRPPLRVPAATVHSPSRVLPSPHDPARTHLSPTTPEVMDPSCIYQIPRPPAGPPSAGPRPVRFRLLPHDQSATDATETALTVAYRAGPPTQRPSHDSAPPATLSHLE